jgi:hypothetical protein
MRFLVTDAPNNSITEALVDEVLVTRADVADALTVSSPTPVLGGPVTFHLAAPGLAGASWLLLISLATGPVHLPPLGTLDLGPAFQPLATGQLGPSGTAAFGMTLPGDPGLDLVRVHAQAVFMGGPGLISNRVDLTLRRP